MMMIRMKSKVRLCGGMKEIVMKNQGRLKQIARHRGHAENACEDCTLYAMKDDLLISETSEDRVVMK
jgi:hypothetical protein